MQGIARDASDRVDKKMRSLLELTAYWWAGRNNKQENKIITDCNWCSEGNKLCQNKKPTNQPTNQQNEQGVLIYLGVTMGEMLTYNDGLQAET